ncbi:helix-turn-helix transcriptional regulator (plasmid) [Roseomonas sp. CCTCC AB2023176]|uniref:helix-turn-helix transcriptional regulator n=1 Tax=Roseomonas sp. CCTCC AB2023176 TaxID=3342640 RepID=UPI0035D770FA
MPPPVGVLHAAPPLLAHGRKRDLLGAVMTAHGPVALLCVGEAVTGQGFQPMLHALLRARGPEDLIRRWMRLERYAHSHHRTIADHLDAAGAALRHVALDGPPPSAAEDILVLGVYVGLLRALGCRNVAGAVGRVCVALPDGGWDAEGAARCVATGDTATWRLSWSVAPVPEARPADFPDPLDAPAVSFGNCPEAPAVAALLTDDPGRQLPLHDAAMALGLSPRALQRRLASHGLTLGAVIRAVQVRHACTLLSGDDPLPAIGFVCGFSDQAHFTRAFRARLNMTPGAYRALVRSGEPLRCSAVGRAGMKEVSRDAPLADASGGAFRRAGVTLLGRSVRPTGVRAPARAAPPPRPHHRNPEETGPS